MICDYHRAATKSLPYVYMMSEDAGKKLYRLHCATWKEECLFLAYFFKTDIQETVVKC